MGVLRFTGRRLLISIPILIFASLFVFLLAINSGNPLAYLFLTHTPHATHRG